MLVKLAARSCDHKPDSPAELLEGVVLERDCPAPLAARHSPREGEGREVAHDVLHGGAPAHRALHVAGSQQDADVGPDIIGNTTQKPETFGEIKLSC